MKSQLFHQHTAPVQAHTPMTVPVGGCVRVQENSGSYTVGRYMGWRRSRNTRWPVHCYEGAFMGHKPSRVGKCNKNGTEDTRPTATKGKGERGGQRMKTNGSNMIRLRVFWWYGNGKRNKLTSLNKSTTSQWQTETIRRTCVHLCTTHGRHSFSLHIVHRVSGERDRKHFPPLDLRNRLRGKYITVFLSTS